MSAVAEVSEVSASEADVAVDDLHDLRQREATRAHALSVSVASGGPGMSRLVERARGRGPTFRSLRECFPTALEYRDQSEALSHSSRDTPACFRISRSRGTPMSLRW